MARRRRKTVEQRVGENLRAAREHQGLSQAELARRSGVSQSNILRIEEGGRNCTVGTLVKLAKGLKVEPADLLADVSEKPKPARAEKIFYRVLSKLRDRDAESLRAVEDLIRALDRITG